MPVFSDPIFMGLVGIYFVLGQITSVVSRTNGFGLFNGFAIALLFGWRSLALLFLISVFYWGGLSFFIKLQSSKKKSWLESALRIAVSVGLYGSVIVLFITHKNLLEPRNDFSGFFLVRELTTFSKFKIVETGISIFQLLAISYIALRLIDLVRSVLGGTRLLNPLALSGYLVPFFMTPAGPLNVYSDHVKMDNDDAPNPSAAHFIDNSFLIVSGYFLKFVVAQLFSILIIGVHGTWPTKTFADTTLFLFYVFLEFGGYSLIALGVGRLLGVPTPVNFNHPYFSRSVSEFWSRWHMSLGTFVRRNIYTPTQVALMRRFGRKNRNAAYITNVLALWLPFAFVGVWHRFSWTFLIWGVVVGAIVAAEKILRDFLLMPSRVMLSKWRWFAAPLGFIYTIIVVIITLNIATGEFVR